MFIQQQKEATNVGGTSSVVMQLLCLSLSEVYIYTSNTYLYIKYVFIRQRFIFISPVTEFSALSIFESHSFQASDRK